MSFSCLKIYRWNRFGWGLLRAWKQAQERSKLVFTLEVKPQEACFFSPPCKAQQRAVPGVHPMFSEWLICDPDVWFPNCGAVLSSAQHGTVVQAHLVLFSAIGDGLVWSLLTLQLLSSALSELSVRHTVGCPLLWPPMPCNTLVNALKNLVLDFSSCHSWYWNLRFLLTLFSVQVSGPFYKTGENIAIWGFSGAVKIYILT